MARGTTQVPQRQNRAPRVSLDEPVETYEGPALEPEGSAVGDAVMLGAFGQMKDFTDFAFITPEPGFSAIDNIPEGYESFASQLRFARSSAELEARIANIDENLDIRRRQGERGLLATLGGEAVAALIDPTTYLGAGVAKSAGIASRSIGIAAPSIGLEMARTVLDPTDTPAEAILSVTTIGAFSTVLATGERVLGRRAVGKAAAEEVETFTPDPTLVSRDAVDIMSPDNAQMRVLQEPVEVERAPKPAPKPAPAPKPFVPDVSHLDAPEVSASGRLVREQTIDLKEDGGQFYLEFHPDQGDLVKGQVTLDGDGHAIININTDQIENAAEAANTRGPTAMRDMVDEILAAFPDIKTARVERVTGASTRVIEADEARIERMRQNGLNRNKPRPQPTPSFVASRPQPEQFITPIADNANGRISSRYNERRNVKTPKGPGSKVHKGVDYAFPEGTPIRAPQAGKVTHAGPNGGYGTYVRIEYGDGTVVDGFGHMSQTNVQVGQTVRQGDVIGFVGSTGRSTGPHLHHERKVNGQFVDPRENLDVTVGPAGAGAEPVYDVGTVQIPQSLVIDGRGLSIVDSKDPNVTAGYVRPQTVDEIVESVADEVRAADEPAMDPSSFGGPQKPPQAQMVPVRHVDVNGKESTRMVPVEQIQAAQERAQSRPGPKPVVRDETKNLTPQQLERMAVRLEETAEALSAAAARHKREKGGRQLMVPKKTRKPTGKEIAEGADPNGRVVVGDEWIRAEERIDQLLDEAENVRGQATYQDGHFVTDEFGESMWVPGADRQRPKKADPEDALLRTTKRIEALRARYERAMEASDNARSEGLANKHLKSAQGILEEIDKLERPGLNVDELPYAPRNNVDDALHGEHIVLNTDKLIKEFPNKPWTRWQTPGVKPLPDDAFADAAEWVQFVALHEVYHSVVAKGAKESAAAYENKINKLAYDALERDRTTFKPSRDKLEHAAIAPTPRGQLERLIKNPDSPVFESIDRLAGDNAMFTARSRAGAATTPGGSVFQRSELWTRDFVELRGTLRNFYAQAAQGLPDGASRVARNIKKGSISREAFDARVIRAGLGIGKEEDAFVKKAAAALQEVFAKVEREAADVGLFPGPARMRAEAEQLYKAADRMQDRFGIMAVGEVAEMRTRAADLMAQSDKPILPRGSAGYFPHTYNVSVLLAKRDLAIERLTQAFTREGAPNPDLSAKAAYDKLINDDVQVHGGVSKPGYVQHRALPWTDEEAFDFLQQDIEVVMRVYLKRMGSQIEMHRTFGDAHGGAEIERLMDAFDADPDVEFDDALKAIQIWTDARDRILGQLHGSDPLSMSNRTVRALKNFGNLVTLGKVAESQIGDVARLTMVQGLGLGFARGDKDAPAGLIQGMVEAATGLRNPKDIRIGRLDAKMSGEALDYAIASTNARMVESDDFLIVQNQTWVERALAKAQFPFFVANGLIPITVTLKTAAGYAAAHNIVHEAKTLARAVRGAGDDPRYTEIIDLHRQLKGQGEGRAAAWDLLDDEQMAAVNRGLDEAEAANADRIAELNAALEADGLTPMTRDQIVKGEIPETSPVDEKTLAGIRARLARNGIDEIDAMIIADMPVEQSPTGMYLVDVDTWRAAGTRGERAAELTRAGVNGEVRRTVMTPGPLDRPVIFDGIFHDRRGQKQAYEAIQKDRALYEKRREQMNEAGIWQLEKDDPARIAAGEELAEIKGRITKGYNTLGVDGRKERPMFSLPFQLKSFSMAAGSKIMKNLFTGPERNKIGGLFGMVAGGALLAYLRSNAGTTAWEFVVDTIDHSSMGAWLTDFAKQIDAAGDLQMLGNEYDEDGNRYGDEVGAALGPAVGRIFDAFEGLLNDDIEGKQRATLVMNAVPFLSLMWLDNSLLSLKDIGRAMMDGSGGGQPLDPDAPAFANMMGVEMRGRRGVPSRDPRAGPEEFELLDKLEPFTDTNAGKGGDGKGKRDARRWHRGVDIQDGVDGRRFNNFGG